MKRSRRRKTVTFQMNKPAVRRFRQSLSSHLNRAKRLRLSKNKTNGKGAVEVKRPGNGNNKPPKFEAARRAAICSVMEEEDGRHGISLAESRRQLIIRYLLTNIELMWWSRCHLNYWTDMKRTELKNLFKHCSNANLNIRVFFSLFSFHQYIGFITLNLFLLLLFLSK